MITRTHRQKRDLTWVYMRERARQQLHPRARMGQRREGGVLEALFGGLHRHGSCRILQKSFQDLLILPRTEREREREKERKREREKERKRERKNEKENDKGRDEDRERDRDGGFGEWDSDRNRHCTQQLLIVHNIFFVTIHNYTQVLLTSIHNNYLMNSAESVIHRQTQTQT